jgi:hypothetical protein
MLALVPTPIGVGPAYHPPPAVHAACARAPLRSGARMHLELFANRRVVIVPGAIGLRGGRSVAGRVVAARCRSQLWTLDPTGVVRFDGRATLGSLFRVWGRRLGPARLLGFRGHVRLYRNGSLWRGDPRALALRDGDEIVLQVGGFVPPHAAYRFPRH